MIALVFGCTMPDVSTSEEAGMAKQHNHAQEARAALAAFHAAIEAESVDDIMAAFSDDYSDSYGTNRSGLRTFYDGQAARGDLYPEVHGQPGTYEHIDCIVQCNFAIVAGKPDA